MRFDDERDKRLRTLRAIRTMIAVLSITGMIIIGYYMIFGTTLNPTIVSVSNPDGDYLHLELKDGSDLITDCPATNEKTIITKTSFKCGDKPEQSLQDLIEIDQIWRQRSGE